MSAHAAITDFLDFMRSEGVEPVDRATFVRDITSGEVIRFTCVGERRRSKNGWAKLYLDQRPAGAFGNWRLGINRRWSSGTANELSPEERRALSAEWEQQKAERSRIRLDAEEGAARDSVDLWTQASPATFGHRYVDEKGIDPAPLRQDGSLLLIPMTDDSGRLWNVQRIAQNGEKRFMKGGRIDGLFAIIGHFTPDTVGAVLVEGYATGDTVHRATGLPAIVTFNTSNMPKVARIWHELRPDLEYTVFADDDEKTAQKALAEGRGYKNPGIEVAEAVASEIGAYIAYPRGTPSGRAA